jgi:hypothetical protein
MTFKRKPCGDWINLDHIECFTISPGGFDPLDWQIFYFLINEPETPIHLDEEHAYDSKEEAQKALDDWMQS